MSPEFREIFRYLSLFAFSRIIHKMYPITPAISKAPVTFAPLDNPSRDRAERNTIPAQKLTFRFSIGATSTCDILFIEIRRSLKEMIFLSILKLLVFIFLISLIFIILCCVCTFLCRLQLLSYYTSFYRAYNFVPTHPTRQTSYSEKKYFSNRTKRTSPHQLPKSLIPEGLGCFAAPSAVT